MCCNLRQNITQQVWNLIRNDIAKPKTLQPPVRFELTAPSIQDQSSNHGAKKAYVLWSETEFNSTGMKVDYKLYWETKNCAAPCEIRTDGPSIQDQWSNHWAKKAFVLWYETEFDSTGMKLD